jgi:hypothetical protein
MKVQCKSMEGDFDTVDLYGNPHRRLDTVSCNSYELNCTETFLFYFPVFLYVAFRNPNPDEDTLNDVKKDLRRNGLDFNQLVKWETKYC